MRTCLRNAINPNCYLSNLPKRILKSLKQSTILSLPSSSSYDCMFRFQNTANPYAELDKNMSKINESDREVTRKLRKFRNDILLVGGSTYGSKIANIPEHSIRVILGMIKASGIGKWRPDILSGAPDSLYNSIHQQVFYKTFEATIINFGYRCVF